MKRTLIWVMLVLIPVLVQGVSIETIGYGATEEAAIDDAKRNAVEQGLGTLLASETLVENFQLANDRIYSRAQGFVKKYEVLKKEKQIDDSWEVRIRAEVTEIVDEILKDRMALDLLLSWVQRPRVAVMLDPDNLTKLQQQAAENEIIRLLRDKGFNVVDPSTVDDVRRRRIGTAKLADDPTTARAIGLEANAELVILGTVSVTEEGANLSLGGMVSRRSNVTARLIRTDTGEILATDTFSAARIHSTAETAELQAIEAACGNLAQYLFRQVIQVWGDEQANAARFTVEFHQVSYNMKKQIVGCLRDLKPVTEVSTHSYANQVLRLMVSFSGNVEALGGALDGLACENFRLQITGETPNSLTVTVVSKP